MDVKRVPPDEAHRLVQEEGYTYLDVRSEPEWQSGHVPGSRNVPLAFQRPGQGMVPNAEFVEVCRRLFPADARLIVGCRSGQRSLRAAGLLQQAGFTDVVDMAGGMAGEADMFGRVSVPGWAARGLPVTRECPAEDTWAELSRPR